MCIFTDKRRWVFRKDQVVIVNSLNKSGKEEDVKKKNYRTHSHWRQDEDNVTLIRTYICQTFHK